MQQTAHRAGIKPVEVDYVILKHGNSGPYRGVGHVIQSAGRRTRKRNRRFHDERSGFSTNIPFGKRIPTSDRILFRLPSSFRLGGRPIGPTCGLVSRYLGRRT